MRLDEWDGTRQTICSVSTLEHSCILSLGEALNQCEGSAWQRLTRSLLAHPLVFSNSTIWFLFRALVVNASSLCLPQLPSSVCADCKCEKKPVWRSGSQTCTPTAVTTDVLRNISAWVCLHICPCFPHGIISYQV